MLLRVQLGRRPWQATRIGLRKVRPGSARSASRSSMSFPSKRRRPPPRGQIIGLLKSKGLPLGALDDLDPFIAATAIEQQMVLATGNIAHYERIVDLGFPLELANWREP